MQASPREYYQEVIQNFHKQEEGLPFAHEAQELADTGSCLGILLLHKNTVAELLQQRIPSSEILMSKMESDTGLAVDSNRAIGIELMEQVTERVIWTAMEQATESVTRDSKGNCLT
ncbi:hypothetical protein F2Q69_00030491 [Brassica cretica]|uniref:Uncharacterized protein n=1 Tax=Brassica cretica TaxID=69181 RepID=A0A8S9S7T0_BRACR|nr:hypothetical protein F2Q69_00030491 [Brassica cretica]